MKISKGKWLVILGALLVIIDQIIKILVKTNMSIGESIDVFSWFKILFVENKGMAFGMSFGGVIGKYLLTTFRILLFAFLCWWMNKLLKRSDVPVGVFVGLTLIAAGALGNIVDCMFYGRIFSESLYMGPVAEFGGTYAPFMQGRVVDMFYFPLFEFVWPSWMPFVGGETFRFFEPVFNFADSCVTVGAFYLVLFQYKFFSKEEHKEETE